MLYFLFYIASPQWWPISRSTNFFFMIGPMRLAVVFGARYSQSLTHTDSQRTLERMDIGITYVKVVHKA
jgi:hypothetical protein